MKKQYNIYTAYSRTFIFSFNLSFDKNFMDIGMDFWQLNLKLNFPTKVHLKISLKCNTIFYSRNLIPPTKFHKTIS